MEVEKMAMMANPLALQLIAADNFSLDYQLLNDSPEPSWQDIPTGALHKWQFGLSLQAKQSFKAMTKLNNSWWWQDHSITG